MEILGVGSTTIKRWANNGYLPFIRTAGGHRRFRESDVRRLLTNANRETNVVEGIEQFLHWLHHKDLYFIHGQLLQLHESLGNWFSVSDYIGRVLRQIGTEWQEGRLNVIQEHLATNKLGQVVTSFSALISLPDSSPKCLLATLSDEKHTHGVLLAQLCMRSIGINALIGGYDMSPALLRNYISEAKVDMVALSASSWQSDKTVLARQCYEVATVCQNRDVIFLLGGDGAWPSDLAYGNRCNSYDEFREVLGQLQIDSPKFAKSWPIN